MQPNAVAIIALRAELAARHSAATRQWLAARTTYRRLHGARVKDFAALRDAARRLDLLEHGRAALLKDLEALSD